MDSPALRPVPQIDIHFCHGTSALDGAENGSGGRGGFAQPTRGTTCGGTFVVEVCTSQEDDRWKEVSACHGADFSSG